MNRNGMYLQLEETQCEKHLWQEFDFLKGLKDNGGGCGTENLRRVKGKQEMCHAAVSTESEFFLVKVFNSKLKDKFTPSKIIMISKYYWHSCFLEVMLISLVCDTEFDQISVSKHIIRKDGDTSDYQKFGVGFIFSESRTEDHILCDLNDSTGMIEVLMLGNEEKIQCKERNKLQLTFLELSKTGEKLYLKSRVHSFINGEVNSAEERKKQVRITRPNSFIQGPCLRNEERGLGPCLHFVSNA
ncbi:LOW QUALITY PROTEIN: interferon-inducible protein AIM2 [Bos mutus]|uniref:LOW QUALITY PROTEIN: interferon-inducible protein AIM2 n=1 Tax=Bos mutus TaxID=72004 RepID=UPI0038B66911